MFAHWSFYVPQIRQHGIDLIFMAHQWAALLILKGLILIVWFFFLCILAFSS